MMFVPMLQRRNCTQRGQVTYPQTHSQQVSEQECKLNSFLKFYTVVLYYLPYMEVYFQQLHTCFSMSHIHKYVSCIICTRVIFIHKCVNVSVTYSCVKSNHKNSVGYKN